MKIGRNIATMIATHAAIPTAHQDAPVLIGAHAIAVDPHGDRAYADGLIAALAPSFEEIGDTILGAPAASVEFAGIVAGYAAFLLLWHDVYGDNAGSQNLHLTFNGDGGNNYDLCILDYGTAPTTTHAASHIRIGQVGYTGAEELHDNGKVRIFNRAASEKFVSGRSLRCPEGAGEINDVLPKYIASKWRNVTDEIHTITITAEVGNFVAGSRFVLLGVKT